MTIPSTTTTDLPDVSTDLPLDLTNSLLVPSTDVLPSISPPLITTEQTSEIQEKKEEFTRQLLSKSLHRESNNLPTEKTMSSPTITHRTPIVKPVIAPRLQKPVVDNRRGNSVERYPPPPPPPLIRNKLPTATSCTAINNPNHQRLGKISLDIFQPQSKCNNIANKKSITVNTKPKVLSKVNVPKVKISSAISDKEIIESNK